MAYQAKQSIDFSVFRSNIYQRFYPRGSRVAMYSWLLFGVIGVITGVMAFLVDVIVESLVIWKWKIT